MSVNADNQSPNAGEVDAQVRSLLKYVTVCARVEARRNRVAPEDIVSNVLLRCLQHRGDDGLLPEIAWREPGDRPLQRVRLLRGKNDAGPLWLPPAYVTAMVRNTAIDLARKSRRDVLGAARARQRAGFRQDILADAPVANSRRGTSIDWGSLDGAFSRMTPRQFAIVRFRVVGGMGLEQIARCLGMSTVSVFRQYHRALLLIAKVVKPQAKQSEPVLTQPRSRAPRQRGTRPNPDRDKVSE